MWKQFFNSDIDFNVDTAKNITNDWWKIVDILLLKKQSRNNPLSVILKYLLSNLSNSTLSLESDLFKYVFTLRGRWKRKNTFI